MTQAFAKYGFAFGLVIGLAVSLPIVRRYVLKQHDRISQHMGYRRGYRDAVANQAEQA